MRSQGSALEDLLFSFYTLSLGDIISPRASKTSSCPTYLPLHSEPLHKDRVDFAFPYWFVTRHLKVKLQSET